MNWQIILKARNREIEHLSEVIRTLRDELKRTRDALRTVVEQINDYERVNNLAPNPGRTECWDSVAIAEKILYGKANG